MVAKASKIAAHLLEANEDDLEFADGSVPVKGSPGSSHDDRRGRVRGVHRRTTCPTASSRPSTPTPPTTRRTSPSRTAPTCARSRSTPRPGSAKIRKYVCVDDIGTPINPLIVEGQVHGGLAQGIAQALFEEAVYDEAGNLTTGTFVDYTLPSAADLPSFTTDRTETPSTYQPARGQGRRRGRHHRVDPGGDQRGRRRAAAVRRATTSRCRPRPERVWRAIHGAEKSERDRGGHRRLRRREYQHLGRR